MLPAVSVRLNEELTYKLVNICRLGLYTNMEIQTICTRMNTKEE